MKKFLIAILGFCVCFLLVFSTYRVLNGGKPLRLEVFIENLKLLDFQFDNLYHYVSLLTEDWQTFIDKLNEPLSSFNADTISSFFASFGRFFSELGLKIQYFFNLIGTAIKVLFGFLFDFIELFVSIIKVFFSMLGIGLQA